MVAEPLELVPMEHAVGFDAEAVVEAWSLVEEQKHDVEAEADARDG